MSKGTVAANAFVVETATGKKVQFPRAITVDIVEIVPDQFGTVVIFIYNGTEYSVDGASVILSI